MIDKALSWMPDGARKVLDTLFLAQGTPMFRILMLITQYSDFAARYAMYMKLIEQGHSEKQAIKIALDNQINYNWGSGKAIRWLQKAPMILNFVKFTEGMQRNLRHALIEQPLNFAVAAMTASSVGNDSPAMQSVLTKNLGGMFPETSGIVNTMLGVPILRETGLGFR